MSLFIFPVGDACLTFAAPVMHWTSTTAGGGPIVPTDAISSSDSASSILSA